MGVVGRAGVQACASDADVAALHTVAVQRTSVNAVEDGRAGGQRHVAGVDKPAPIGVDAGRVGDDDFGALTGDFYITADLAGIAGVDFIENDTRSAGGQPGVGRNKATELRLYISAAVVEDGAARLHIKLAVDITADAGGTGRLDIDLRQAVGGAKYRGALAVSATTISCPRFLLKMIRCRFWFMEFSGVQFGASVRGLFQL